MAFDDLKEFNGEAYTGMRVGGHHTWHYTDALWREEKVAPDQWEFTFSSVKRRDRGAPEGSGAPPGTQYHWYILAHQRVRKIDEDSYTTLMSGLKYKVAHKRPHWRKWSSDYPEQEPERDRIIGILEATLVSLRHSSSAGKVPGSSMRVTSAEAPNVPSQGHQETLDELEARDVERAEPRHY